MLGDVEERSNGLMIRENVTGCILMAPVKKLFLFVCVYLYICVGLMPMPTETGVIPLTMASCLHSVASTGEQLSALTGV